MFIFGVAFAVAFRVVERERRGAWVGGCDALAGDWGGGLVCWLRCDLRGTGVGG